MGPRIWSNPTTARVRSLHGCCDESTIEARPSLGGWRLSDSDRVSIDNPCRSPVYSGYSRDNRRGTWRTLCAAPWARCAKSLRSAYRMAWERCVAERLHVAPVGKPPSTLIGQAGLSGVRRWLSLELSDAEARCHQCCHSPSIPFKYPSTKARRRTQRTCLSGYCCTYLALVRRRHLQILK